VNQQQRDVMEQCATLSMAGKISFGDVIGRLLQAGVERYHADYSRMETTYYLPSGESHVVPMGHELMPIATAFRAEVVEASVRQAQRGEIVYAQFVERTTQAGCIGYFVQLIGKRVHYFGRNGEIHTEWFPGAKPN
jgi:uncharacterized protein YbcV (DUF1398 family)